MSDLRRTLLRYINTDTASLVSSDNGTPRDGNSLTFFIGTQNVVQCHLRLNDGDTYFKPEAGCTWFFAVDDSYVVAHPDYIVTNTPDFNIVGDWTDLDASNGKICFRVDATSTALKAAVGALASKTMIGELWYTPPLGYATLLCQMSVVVKNIATEMGSESELVYTTSGTLSLDVETGDLVMRFPDGTIAQRWSKT